MSILRRITNLFRRSKLDQEIEAELRSHKVEAAERSGFLLESAEESGAGTAAVPHDSPCIARRHRANLWATFRRRYRPPCAFR
jgi:hypothetical protein